MLLVAEIRATFQQQPTGLPQDKNTPFALHAAGFLGTDSVESFVHICDDTKAVENMQCLGALLANELQIGLPYVRADEHNLGHDFLARGGDEYLKGSPRR